MTATPGQAPTPQPLERSALTRELADFLIELSIALHKHAMYPQGHPSLDPAAAGVTRRAEHLLEQRTTLALGVARQQLVIEGVATDPKNPLLAELAGRLHRHHLGAVTFHRGLRVTEVVDLLRTLAVDADRSGQPLGLGPAEQLRSWDHVRLHRVTYEKLELLHEDQPSADEKAPKEGGLRSAQLWVGLARAALTAEAIDDAAAAPPTEPAAIAKAIDEHPQSAAYDQVIVGYLLQIADELKNAGGAEAMALRRRTSKLVGALQPSTLRRLVEMGGDNAQRFQFAINATHGLAVDAVLDIVRAMADAVHKTVSDPLVRMLSKLAQHAEQGPTDARLQADEALRDQVRDLLRGWSLEDPNPEAYGQALQKMAAAAPDTASHGQAKHVAEPLRIVQTAVETGVMGVGAWRAVERLVAAHHVGELVDMLDESPDASRAPVRGDIAPLWTRVTSPDVVRQLANTEPPDFVTLDRVLSRLPVDAFEPLLDLLGASESRTTRRGLLDRLTRAPRELGPIIAARLSGDIPWYVTRNLLLILDGLPEVPRGFSTAAFIAHEDARVRREAFKVALKVPAERDRALLGALRDADPRTVRLALTAALDDCPPPALPPIVQLVHSASVTSELRVLAIKVLGRVGNTAALNALLELVDGGTSWLGRQRLANRSIEFLAALMALAAGWHNDVRVTALLALAASSSDPDIRNAALAGKGTRGGGALKR
ncbi:MAG TPA: HEAT repeat domain-containing protein [Gemmatimonadales bacterium]|nr:HEAT repeat domain-containing protein [Gemmatimonadales bacterium]